MWNLIIFDTKIKNLMSKTLLLALLLAFSTTKTNSQCSSGERNELNTCVDCESGKYQSENNYQGQNGGFSGWVGGGTKGKMGNITPVFNITASHFVQIA